MNRWPSSIFALFCLSIAACSNNPADTASSAAPSTEPSTAPSAIASAIASAVASPAGCAIHLDHAAYVYRNGLLTVRYEALATMKGCENEHRVFELRTGQRVLSKVPLTGASRDIKVDFPTGLQTKSLNITAPRGEIAAPHPSDTAPGTVLVPIPIGTSLPAQFSPISDLKPGLEIIWHLREAEIR